jgi:LysM repeat protein
MGPRYRNTQLIEEVTLAPDNSLKGAESNNNKGPLEHIVLPTDTLAGICIRYKVTPTQLRQANRFSGSNLSLAPSKLIIPVNGIIDPTLHARSDNTRALITALPQLSYKDAQLYLKMAKWNLKAATEDAKADLEWEAMHQHEEEEEKQQPHAVVHEAIPLLNSTEGIM